MSNLFREKSLQRISSPEQLNTYVRVSTPSVWLLLSAIVVLLIGICLWGVFGHMDTVLSVAAVSEAGEAMAYVHAADVQKISADTIVKIGEVEGKVLSISTEPVAVDEEFTEYMRHVGGLQEGEWVFEAQLEADCPDGVYAAQIIVDSVAPMSFVLN